MFFKSMVKACTGEQRHLHGYEEAADWLQYLIDTIDKYVYILIDYYRRQCKMEICLNYAKITALKEVFNIL